MKAEKNRNLKTALKLISLLLSILLLLTALAGCKSREVPAGKLGKTVVGQVGEHDVFYDELYFLISNYKDAYAQNYEGDELEEVLEEVFSENVVTNYAILSLCEKRGVEISKKDLENKIQGYVDDIIEEEFDSNRSDYIASLSDIGLTDRYVRFIAEVDSLYQMLPVEYAKDGLVSTDEAEITEYIKENFVRCWHFMIANESGDDVEENRAIAEELLEDLLDGKTTMYDVIGGKYNEDLLIPSDGYCFTYGSMEKAYEDAAFDLEVGEYSEVVESYGETGLGVYTSCFYVIQRLSLSDEYISLNFDTLNDEYSNAVIVKDLEAEKAALSFVANDFFDSLDLLSLEYPEAGFDYALAATIAVSVLSVAAVVVCVIIAVKKFKNSKKNIKPVIKN